MSEDLTALLQRHGAELVEVDDRVVARRFAAGAGEDRALRAGGGIVDLPWLGRVRVTGGDRVGFLQGMLSNDVATLGPGTGCHALLLSEQGKTVADLIVLAAADESFLLGVETSLVAAQTALERFIVADDVELVPPNAPEHVFALLGPAAPAVLTRIGVPAPVGAYQHVTTRIDGLSLQVVAVPAPGVGGFLCYVPLVDAARFWVRCRELGDATPVGQDAFEALRIESGMPWHGRDVTADTLALEAPYEDAISFRKGCYLGQEVMERVTARGHVNRKLVGVEMVGSTDLPTSGTRLFAGERDVGWVTSAAQSPHFGHIIALAYVRREQLEPGTVLALGTPAGISATVRGLPF